MLGKVFHLSSYCKTPSLILAFCWIVGLVAGASYSLATIDSSLLLMRMLPYERVSIVSFVVNLFPIFLIFLTAKRLISNIFIFLTVLFKAFVFSFCLVGILFTSGTAGWLIYLLVSFTQVCTVVPFIWLSLCLMHDSQHKIMRDLAIYLIIYFTVRLIDIYCVAPYLANLMTLS